MKPLGAQLFALCESDQGQAFISDGIEHLSDDRIYDLARQTIATNERLNKKLKAWLTRRGQPIVVVMLMLLTFPALTYAQTQTPPTQFQIVARCMAGEYEVCELSGGHWYYRQGGVWTRDDGLIGKPPAVPVVPCPSDTSKLYQQLMKDLDYRGQVAEPRFKHSFWFSSFALAGSTVFDFTSSRMLRERNPLLTNSHHEISGPKFLLVNGVVYAATLPFERKHPKAMAVIRYVFAGVHIAVGVHNQTVRQ
jgi:hypothetical protein